MKSSKARPTWIVVLVIGVWVVSTVLALTWGMTLNWPDFVHVNYGFPLVWATHTVSTLGGPADAWSVSVSALLVDLVLWLGSMTVAVAVILHVLGGRA